MTTLTNRQARRFMLYKHGLLGGHKFIGKRGVLDFFKQAGCVQFDPIDVCGRNADLVLQSRVKNYTKKTLEELLYKDRLLLDYPDKNTSIILTEDFPHFMRFREKVRRRAAEQPELIRLMELTRKFIEENGAASPDDLKLESDFKWRAHIVWSSGNNLSGSVMEQMYGAGDLIIHHKNRARKFYDIAERHIPVEILRAADPLPDETEHRKWLFLRRVGAIGLLWNRSSEALWRFKSEEINKFIDLLAADKKITEVAVEGSRARFYYRSEDAPLMEKVLGEPENIMETKPRCELLAPLDNFLWDRALIKTLFNFHYSWEIYTPAANRKYGHYVLPLLRGESLIGRVEAVADKKANILAVKNIWYEEGVKPTKKVKSDVDNCLKRFAEFNECDCVKE